MTVADVMAVQKMLGVEVDGKWGKKSQQALDEWQFWNEGSVVDVDDADVEVPDTTEDGYILFWGCAKAIEKEIINGKFDKQKTLAKMSDLEILARLLYFEASDNEQEVTAIAFTVLNRSQTGNEKWKELRDVMLDPSGYYGINNGKFFDELNNSKFETCVRIASALLSFGDELSNPIGGMTMTHAVTKMGSILFDGDLKSIKGDQQKLSSSDVDRNGKLKNHSQPVYKKSKSDMKTDPKTGEKYYVVYKITNYRVCGDTIIYDVEKYKSGADMAFRYYPNRPKDKRVVRDIA